MNAGWYIGVEGGRKALRLELFRVALAVLARSRRRVDGASGVVYR